MHEAALENSITRSTRSIAYRLVGVQAVIVLIIAGCWLIGGVREALSALLGGAACVLPGFYFARRFFASSGSTEARVILMAFYGGEIIKLALSIGLVALIVLFIPISILPFIVGFVMAQFAFWLAPFVVKLEPVVGKR